MQQLAWTWILCGLTAGAYAVPGSADESPAAITYRPLTLNDYPIKQDVKGASDAYTAVRMSYQYEQQTMPEGDGQRAEVRMVDITCSMLPEKSWRRATPKDPAALLQHEQGYFDICEAAARRLRLQTTSIYPVGHGADASSAQQDLDASLKKFFAKRTADMRQEWARYNKATKHGRLAAKKHARGSKTRVVQARK